MLGQEGAAPRQDTQARARPAISLCFGSLFLSGDSCRFERAGDLGQSRFLSFAYRHAASAKKPSAFVCRFGDMLADLLQPVLIGGGIAGRLGIDYCCGLPQRLDAFFFDLAEVAVLELVL